MTECDEIVIAMNIVSKKKINNIATKKTNTTATNVTSTTSINCHSKKVRDCYILHAVSLGITYRLLIFMIISYYYVKQRGTI